MYQIPFFSNSLRRTISAVSTVNSLRRFSSDSFFLRFESSSIFRILFYLIENQWIQIDFTSFSINFCILEPIFHLVYFYSYCCDCCCLMNLPLKMSPFLLLADIYFLRSSQCLISWSFQILLGYLIPSSLLMVDLRIWVLHVQICSFVLIGHVWNVIF